MTQSVTTVAVIGAGTMGAGIAQVAAQSGHQVLLYDLMDGAAAKGLAGIKRGLDGLVERGKITAEARDTTMGRLKPAAALDDLAAAQLVIEAIIEDLEAKRSLFRQLEGIVTEGAILATNTSSISVTAIGKGLKHPERLVGMHFFNPAPIMPLVEVVSGLETSREIAETVFALAAAWNKSPVHARSTPGFIVNRVARPFYGEGLRLFQEGVADIATIDAVAREAGGFRMGPFELMDLVGHDVNFAVTSTVWRDFFNDPRYQPSLIQRELVEAGRLGRKSGRGFYDYRPDAAKPSPVSAPPAQRPARVTVGGDLGPATALLDMIEKTGIAVTRGDSSGAGRILIDSTAIVLTDGRTATKRASAGDRNTVVFDLALDYAKSTRLAIAVADQAEAGTADRAVGLFQALGKAVSVIDDTPGLIVMRLVAMLANEAAEAVHHRVADAAGVDLAMMKGVNYPVGPLTWASRVGVGRIVAVLDNLSAAYGEDRYRASALLRRRQDSGARF